MSLPSLLLCPAFVRKPYPLSSLLEQYQGFSPFFLPPVLTFSSRFPPTNVRVLYAVLLLTVVAGISLSALVPSSDLQAPLLLIS